jgi:hypothetical protein
MAVVRQRYFLVERYLPAIPSERVDLAARRLEALLDPGVRHLLTLVVPGEETCLSVFEAPDPAAVRDLNERAAFDLDRIVEVELVRVGADVSARGGRTAVDGREA